MLHLMDLGYVARRDGWRMEDGGRMEGGWREDGGNREGRWREDGGRMKDVGRGSSSKADRERIFNRG
jgi:hypothetical protein